MIARALLTLALASSAGVAHAQEFEAFRGTVDDVEHVVFGRGLIVVHVTRRAERVEACSYRLAGERLSASTASERCDAPPRLTGWGTETPRAFFGDAELARVTREGLTMEFPRHRGAWLALAEIGQALSPGRCTHPRRYPHGPLGEESRDGLHVTVACLPGVHLSTSPRQLHVRAGNSYADRTPRCEGFADARDFDRAHLSQGGVCFRDFTIAHYTTRADIEEAFHGRCRPAAHGELRCEGFRIRPEEHVTRAAP